ncbi:MAG: sigma-70 family RNA polymerase sigma factor, partial [Acidobacteriota bacterium]
SPPNRDSTMHDPPTEVTRLLVDWRQGNDSALDNLMPIVYDELRRVAQRHMNLEDGSTLQATALVNEAYIRLIDMDVDWQGRVHFFAIAAGLMRRILVDRARRRRTLKRGGGERPVVLDDVPINARPAEELLALDRALEELAANDPRKARVLELRIFGGLTIGETAEALEVGHATVERDLKMAKAWIMARLRGRQET